MRPRVSTLVTRLSPEEAFTLIEFLDQLRDGLMQTYADDMTAMLYEASQPTRQPDKGEEDEEPF